MMGALWRIVGIGRVTLADDAGDVQRLQITEGAIGTGGDDQVTSEVMRAGDFGFAAVPPLGAEALMLRMAGQRSHSFVISTSHRPSRPRDLSPGDAVVYDVRGRQIRLTADGIEIDAAGGAVTVRNATKVRCECDIETTGDVVARADGNRVSLAELHDAYNLHNHPPAAAGGTWGSGPPVPKA